MDDTLNSAESIEQVKKSRKGPSGAAETVNTDLSIGSIVEGVSSVAQGIAGAGRSLGGQVGKLIPGGNKNSIAGEGGGFSREETSPSLISSLGGSISRTAESVVDGTGSVLSTTTGGVGRALSAATEGIGHMTSNAGSLVSGAGDLLSSAADVAGTVLSGAGEVAGAAGEAAGDILGGIGDILN